MFDSVLGGGGDEPGTTGKIREHQRLAERLEESTGDQEFNLEVLELFEEEYDCDLQGPQMSGNQETYSNYAQYGLVDPVHVASDRPFFLITERGRMVAEGEVDYGSFQRVLDSAEVDIPEVEEAFSSLGPGTADLESDLVEEEVGAGHRTEVTLSPEGRQLRENASSVDEENVRRYLDASTEISLDNEKRKQLMRTPNILSKEGIHEEFAYMISQSYENARFDEVLKHLGDYRDILDYRDISYDDTLDDLIAGTSDLGNTSSEIVKCAAREITQKVSERDSF